jgi:phosphoglycerate dehydrogenase-like enzyme
MPDTLRVTSALPLSPQLADTIRRADPRIDLTLMTRAQRRVYREGRPLWPGYPEPAQSEDESEEEAKAALEPILARTQVLLTNPVVPDNIVERAPELLWLQLTSAGVDRLLEAPVVKSHVKVTTASGIHAVPISEYIIGAILAFAKGLPAAAKNKEAASWTPYIPDELEDRTVGIIGVGAIGARTAMLAKALGMRVLAMRRSATSRVSGDATGDPNYDELLPPSDLPYLLAESDYVVLALPLTPESTGMIGEAQLRSMKPNAVIVNIARGAVIDQDALIRVLKERAIKGAALDVFTPEPLPPDSELWALDNVILTPHISGGTPRYMDRAIALFCENLRRHLAAEPLLNVVDPARGY